MAIVVGRKDAHTPSHFRVCLSLPKSTTTRGGPHWEIKCRREAQYIIYTYTTLPSSNVQHDSSAIHISYSQV